MFDYVVLVAERNRALEVEEKLDQYLRPRLYREFSVFVFNATGELIIQQRRQVNISAPATLWNNTCCGLPRPNETTQEATQRRLGEKLDLSYPLVKMFDFGHWEEVGDGR